MTKYAAIILALGAFVPAVANSEYPDKPIRLISTSAPGSGGDTLARLLGEKMAGLLKANIIVENKPGAGGAIAMDYVARSSADGYTITLGSFSTHVLIPASNPKVTYDAIKDFVPIGQVGAAPTLMVASNDFPAGTLDEVIALARKNPGGLQYASWGYGSTGHFCGELLNYKYKTEITHIPYKSVAQIQTDLQGGHVKLAFVDMGSGTSIVKAGRAKAIVSCTERSKSLPDVPSYDDEGVDFDGRKTSSPRWVMYAPAGTPAAALERLSGALRKTLELEDVKSWMLQQGISPVFAAADDVVEQNRNDIKFWTDVARTAKIEMR